MGEDIKKLQDEEPYELMPEITPQMVQDTLRALEAEGLVHYAEGGAYVPTEGGWKLLQEAAPVKEEITAYGHPNVTATHITTLEITKAGEIRKDADCIIAVKADKACADLKNEFKDALSAAKKIEITIEAEGIEDKIIAFGSPALKLIHKEDMVIRKSDFIDNRTLAILSNKAACNLKKELVEKLKNPNTKVKIILEIK